MQLSDKEAVAVRLLMGHLAKLELEDVIGAILKSGAFRVLDDQDGAVVALANKLEPTEADHALLAEARRRLKEESLRRLREAKDSGTG